MHKIPAVGDRVKIREWNDMEAEYKRRFPTQDWISTPCVAFVSEMESLCGKEFTVGAVEALDDKDENGEVVMRIYPLEDITAFMITQLLAKVTIRLGKIPPRANPKRSIYQQPLD